jgi:hypothetical protein
LYFNVFNTTNTENRVNAKYSIKNNITDDNPVFLATKNHTKAITSSARNLRLTDTSRCIVWLAGSFPCPLKKMTRISITRSVNETDRKKIQLKLRPVLRFEVKRNPAVSNRISNEMRKRIYLNNGFNGKVTSENL